MDLTLCDLEIPCIDPMSREQLLGAIRRRLDCLPPDLGERLDEEPDGWLRLLLMAARINYALRHLRARAWADGVPGGSAPPPGR